jgi:hypothetical protein
LLAAEVAGAGAAEGAAALVSSEVFFFRLFLGVLLSVVAAAVCSVAVSELFVLWLFLVVPDPELALVAWSAAAAVSADFFLWLFLVELESVLVLAV